MKVKNLFMFGMMIVSILALCGIAQALDQGDIEVKFDSDTLQAGSDNEFQKADEYEVKVIFESDVNESDVQVSAYLRGDKYDDFVHDVTDAFDIDSGTTYRKTLTLTLPKRMERDTYNLYVRVESRDGSVNVISEDYDLVVESSKHEIVIKDVILSPSSGVTAGRALLATVRLQNYGRNDEEDVKVTFSIPGLGVSATDYIDELEEDGDNKDSKSTEELYLRIPVCAPKGEYDAEVRVEFNDGEEVVTKDMTIEVFSSDACVIDGVDDGDSKEGKTIISIGPEVQDVVKGAGGVVYPVTITNAGNTAKTYVINVEGGDWGNFRVSPTNVVTVKADETKSIYIYAEANEDAPAGQQVFGVEIMSGDETLEEVTLKANVVDNGGFGGASLKRALEIGLIVLVVILVILGLIIGFNKLKGDDEDKEEGQSYY